MMENITALNNTTFIRKGNDEIRLNRETITYGRTNFSPAIVNMIEEGGLGFLGYLNKIGLSKEPNIMVLSSKHHYYYDETDLMSVKTLVNIKKLNMIKDPDRFLDTLKRILPQDASFIGCFSDSKSSNGSRYIFLQPSRMLNRFINILDSKTDRSLNQKEVSELLALHGFKIIDMFELDGVTYFHSKPVRKQVELRA
jgi:hypothetical protein